MSNEKEDWESERVFGHAIPRPEGERRCQLTAKIQCVLQNHMPKDEALEAAKEIIAELGL